MREEARKPIGRNVRGDVGRIHAGPAFLDGLVVYVCGENLDHEFASELLGGFVNKHRQRISLLPGRAARHPSSNWGARGALGHYGRQRTVAHRVKCGRVAEEISDANEQFPEERVQFAFVLAKQANVMFEGVNLIDEHATLDAPADGVLLVKGEVMAVVGAEQRHDLEQPTAHIGRDGSGRGGLEFRRAGDVIN